MSKILKNDEIDDSDSAYDSSIPVSIQSMESSEDEMNPKSDRISEDANAEEQLQQNTISNASIVHKKGKVTRQNTAKEL